MYMFIYRILRTKLLKISFAILLRNIVARSEDNVNINCKPPGNPRCNSNTWKRYGGYSNACCSEEEKCTVNEGDCNLDTECLGSLVCMPNSCPVSEDGSRKFHERASCCQQPSGTYILGKDFISTNIFLNKNDTLIRGTI